MLRTSRMDTRLRTSTPRGKRWAGGKRKQLRIELGKDEEARVDLTRNAPDKRAEKQRPKNQLREPKENLKEKRSKSKYLRQDSLPERRRGWGVKEFLLSDITRLRKQFSSRLNNDQTTRSIKGAPRVGRGSDTNFSRPICDTILKRLEGPTKDRTAYWNAFARWISLHQHYIIDGDTYKRHKMPHKYNIILQKSIIWLRTKHKQKLKRHPPC